MKTNSFSKLPRRCALAALAAITVLATVAPAPAAPANGGKALDLSVDPSPPARDVRLPASFSPIVKKASPAVVNIFTTKNVRGGFSGSDLKQFFNDPFFRRFFGGPGGPGTTPEEPADPRSRPRTRQERSLGSGVIVTADGYILTNNHVVEGADEIKVTQEKEKTEFTAKVVGRDPKTDIAILKIDGKGLPFATLADSDKVEVGDVVLAIGNPFGIGQTVTMGIVSATRRGGMGLEDYEDFIQTDASINPGNSGGALMDAQGRLIGINTAILSRTGGNQGVGFAVPINLARHVLDQIVKDGKVRRGLLGVAIQDVTPELAKQFNVPNGAGALVGGVTDDSSAAKAGIKPGDVIVAFDGKPVADSRNLKLMVGKASPGAKVEVKVMRDGKEKSFSITLREMPDARADARAPADNKSEIDALNGVEVGDLTPETRKQFELPASVKGALVLNVDPTSPAYEAGIRAGDVLLEIDRKPIKNAEDAVEVTRTLKEKRVLALVWTRGASRYVVVDESKIR